jgi:hypothetical protein
MQRFQQLPEEPLIVARQTAPLRALARASLRSRPPRPGDGAYDMILADREHEEYLSLIARQEAKDRAARELRAEGRAPMVMSRLSERLLEPEPEWLIKGLMKRGQICLLVAEAKVGKSSVLYDTFRCLADGDPLFGEYPTRLRGEICYFNGEMPENDVTRQMTHTSIQAKNKVHIVDKPLFGGSLYDPEKQDEIIERFTETGVRLWTIDVFRNFFEGASERDETEVQKFFDILQTIRHEADLDGIILVHHANKSGSNRASGSGAFEGSPDMLWTLSMPDGRSGHRELNAHGRGVIDHTVPFKWSAETGQCATEDVQKSQWIALRRAILAMTRDSLVKTGSLDPYRGLYAGYKPARSQRLRALKDLIAEGLIEDGGREYRLTRSGERELESTRAE